MQYKVTISNVGPPLQAEDLKAFEAEFDTVLPSEYREFLLIQNGGVPKPNLFDYHDSMGPNVGGVRHFNSINEKETWDLMAKMRYKREHVIYHSMPINFLPIGEDEGGNAICISTSGDDLGKIYFWEHDKWDSDYIHLVANSFNEFVASLVDYPATIVPAKRKFWNSILRLLRCKRS